MGIRWYIFTPFFLLPLFLVDSQNVKENKNANHSGRNLADCPANSIIDDTGKYCCPSDCEKCGGYGCHEAPGGEFNCCGSKFKNSCSGGAAAPCILEADDDPVNGGACPAGSIVDETGKYCCPAKCGQCGGYGCHKAPGGEGNCCWSNFTDSCENGPAPCVLPEPSDKPNPCADNGRLALYRSFYGCDVSVCCPSSCEVCNTSIYCSGPEECCATNIASSIHINDVDVSCRNHAPPCVLPPEDDPCAENPCQNGARCGYSWESASYTTDGSCNRARFVCECHELGDNYSGEYCELICEDGETPCGVSNIDYYSFPNDVCCTSEQYCVPVFSKSGYQSTCTSKYGPKNCDTNPCLNGGSCLCINENYCYCQCQGNYRGTYCEGYWGDDS